MIKNDLCFTLSNSGLIAQSVMIASNLFFFSTVVMMMLSYSLTDHELPERPNMVVKAAGTFMLTYMKSISHC